MPHQCTHCGKIYPDASEELLKGCECGAKFFYYIRQEKADELDKIKEQIIELPKEDKIKIEQDIREITGMDEEPDVPVILDLESIKAVEPGKYEIDIVNLFKKERPVIYSLEKGKYVIDLSSIAPRKDKKD